MYEASVIVLTCRVESLSLEDFADPSVINIRWYFDNGTEYELTTGVNHTRLGGSGEKVQVTSTLKLSGTSNKSSVFLSEGSYYCQVQLMDRDVLLKTSQAFRVLNTDEHVQASTDCCERTFIDSVESCAAYEVVIPSTDRPTTKAGTQVGSTARPTAVASSTTSAATATQIQSTSTVTSQGEH